jgi:16S rRNA (adenine1518-N6/adenine1519-N6)-dimethyltransferase
MHPYGGLTIANPIYREVLPRVLTVTPMASLPMIAPTWLTPEDELNIDSMVFMVQKEVAKRMVAKPGKKDYGALSIAVQYYSTPAIEFEVPPQSFVPMPEVDSSVIRLDINKVPPVSLKNKELFFRTIKASFGQRRKTLVNALYNSGYFMKTKDEIKVILEGLNINPNQRGETLSLNQFAELSNTIF